MNRADFFRLGLALGLAPIAAASATSMTKDRVLIMGPVPA